MIDNLVHSIINARTQTMKFLVEEVDIGVTFVGFYFVNLSAVRRKSWSELFLQIPPTSKELSCCYCRRRRRRLTVAIVWGCGCLRAVEAKGRKIAIFLQMPASIQWLTLCCNAHPVDAHPLNSLRFSRGPESVLKSEQAHRIQESHLSEEKLSIEWCYIWDIGWCNGSRWKALYFISHSWKIPLYSIPFDTIIPWTSVLIRNYHSKAHSSNPRHRSQHLKRPRTSSNNQLSNIKLDPLWASSYQLSQLIVGCDMKSYLTSSRRHQSVHQLTMVRYFPLRTNSIVSKSTSGISRWFQHFQRKTVSLVR